MQKEIKRRKKAKVRLIKINKELIRAMVKRLKALMRINTAKNIRKEKDILKNVHIVHQQIQKLLVMDIIIALTVELRLKRDKKKYKYIEKFNN